MEPLKTLFIVPTDRVRRWLRRYASRVESGGHFHNARVPIEDGPAIRSSEGYLQEAAPHPHEDPRWPTTCECGYVFQEDDVWQVFQKVIYSNGCTLEDTPPGSMWYAPWLNDWRPGPDGQHLVAKCPGGHIWHIDDRASNCDMPGDNEHRCWVRHGDPATGLVTVDKAGHTCGAGGGSIQTPNWHGFLENGYFVEQRGQSPRS